MEIDILEFLEHPAISIKGVCDTSGVNPRRIYGWLHQERNVKREELMQIQFALREQFNIHVAIDKYVL